MQCLLLEKVLQDLNGILDRPRCWRGLRSDFKTPCRPKSFRLQLPLHYSHHCQIITIHGRVSLPHCHASVRSQKPYNARPLSPVLCSICTPRAADWRDARTFEVSSTDLALTGAVTFFRAISG
ncbi:hypothetical protein SCLCIDRAFT_667279 [Scleroderma citrinum Foug A]|uniref:Uncharacterized protein n=1 Tax=Scleroderma citrinum Foug A TaxID=1036808 RepID=A0A0C3D552_9AGAM|nr:hypothetical protein SCLCIDRAFT_667279 [Scleroderma citrinum Foug A]